MCEKRCPFVICHTLREQRLLEGQEKADVARGRIECANKADDHERPELAEESEAPPRHEHEQ
jgi:hypothetical protein